MADSRLRDKLARHEFFLAPGVFDAMSAMLVERMGFDAVYASVTGSRPRISVYRIAGLATYTDMLNRVSMVVSKSSAPVIADADTGFGGLLNVHHTVRGYEEAGVAAIQIEDQEFPKKCGHTPYRRVVPMADMVAKVKVAVEARSSRDFLVIARTTHARAKVSTRRSRAARPTPPQVRTSFFWNPCNQKRKCDWLVRVSTRPMLANMADGGNTPIRPAAELAQLGYACAIFPAMTALAANAACLRHCVTCATRARAHLPRCRSSHSTSLQDGRLRGGVEVRGKMAGCPRSVS